MFAIRILVCVIGLMSAMACHANDPNMPPRPDPYIEVTLGEEVSSVPDIIKWPTYKDGRYQESRLIQFPSTIHLTLPGGRQLEYKVMNADLWQENLRINFVNLRLLTSSPDTEQAVSILEAELNRLSRTDRDKCAGRIRNLRTSENDPHALSGEQVGCFFELEKGINVRAGIETILTERRQQLKTEWITFLTFTFDANKE